MKKRMLVGNGVAAIIIALEIVVLNLLIPQIGVAAYILLDAGLVAIIMFIANLIINLKGNTKTCLINAGILVLLFVLISGIYASTPLGTQANRTVSELSVAEEPSASEEGFEVTISDGDSSGQIMNYVVCFLLAFGGGKIGMKCGKKRATNNMIPC